MNSFAPWPNSVGLDRTRSLWRPIQHADAAQTSRLARGDQLAAEGKLAVGYAEGAAQDGALPPMVADVRRASTSGRADWTDSR